MQIDVIHQKVSNVQVDIKLWEKCWEIPPPHGKRLALDGVRYKVSATQVLFSTLRPRQNGRHFADDMFKYIFLNENVWIPIEISLTFVPMGSINNNPALFQKMAWRRPGDKPLSEPMMVSSLTHTCVTRPQWVNSVWPSYAMRRHRCGSALAQAAACCPTAIA